MAQSTEQYRLNNNNNNEVLIQHKPQVCTHKETTYMYIEMMNVIIKKEKIHL